MRQECWGRFPRHRLQRNPLVSDPGIHHDARVTHVPWCISGSPTRGGGENVPDIPGACATHNFAYLVRGHAPLSWQKHHDPGERSLWSCPLGTPRPLSLHGAVNPLPVPIIPRLPGGGRPGHGKLGRFAPLPGLLIAPTGLETVSRTRAWIRRYGNTGWTESQVTAWILRMIHLYCGETRIVFGVRSVAWWVEVISVRNYTSCLPIKRTLAITCLVVIWRP